MLARRHASESGMAFSEPSEDFENLLFPKASSAIFRQDAILTNEAEVRFMARIIGSQANGFVIKAAHKNTFSNGVRMGERLPVEIIPLLALLFPVRGTFLNQSCITSMDEIR